MNAFNCARIGRYVALAMAVVLSGCVANPSQTDKAAVAPAPTFYPPLPDAPRIQYLTTIASEHDIAKKPDAFADFILGDKKETQRLTQPYGVALHQGKMYVADTGAGGLAIFDLSSQRFSFFAGSGSGRLQRPINIRIDSDGTRYITDTGRDQVLVYDRDDRFVTAFGAKGQFRPVDLAIAADRLYITDIQHHQIHVLEKRTGKTLMVFGKAGSAAGELFHPTNIALGGNGDIYVVETGNYRVQRFTAEGVHVRSYGEVGTSVGSFARPKGIALDRQGRLLVGDAAFQNIQLFDPSGKLLMFFGENENADLALNLPAGITIDYDNLPLFRKYAEPKFEIEYLILVASQFGPNKIDIFGFGRMQGMSYPADDKPVAAAPSPLS